MNDLVELCPGEAVFLLSQGASEEEGKRLLELLKEAWRRVPSSCRQAMLQYHQHRFRCPPRVVLGAPLGKTVRTEMTMGGRQGWMIYEDSPVAKAGDQQEGYLLWCNRLRMFDLPGGDPWAVLVLGEELAHAYLIATCDPAHAASRPTDYPAFVRWDQAREDAMRAVLYGWRTFDCAEHAKLIAWVHATSSAEVDQQPTSDGPAMHE
jgi:hypothetical protein